LKAIKRQFICSGGSVGGGIAWEILALEPKLAKILFHRYRLESD
jgi:cephalosporin-C deacetylase-like acetyl esterase